MAAIGCYGAVLNIFLFVLGVNKMQNPLLSIDSILIFVNNI